MKVLTRNFHLPAIVIQAAAFMFLAASHAYAVEAFVPTKQMLIGKVVLGQTMTPSEANMLEPVCIMIFAADQARGSGGVWYENLKGNPVLDRPENAIAKDAISFHHYCWAELHMARYYNARDPKEKRVKLLSAYGDYSFMISNPQWLPAGWPYLPKMYVKHGGAAALMGRDSEAITSFLKALEIDPKFDLAYTSLADLMAQKGNKVKALEYVIEGLKHNPGSKRLKRRYTELGGKQPYPTPYEKPAADKPGDISTSETQVPTPEPVTATPDDAPQVTQSDDKKQQQMQDAPPPTNTETTGTPDNPHCRFCP